jgi:hypothetical protein
LVQTGGSDCEFYMIEDEEILIFPLACFNTVSRPEMVLSAGMDRAEFKGGLFALAREESELALGFSNRFQAGISNLNVEIFARRNQEDQLVSKKGPLWKLIDQIPEIWDVNGKTEPFVLVVSRGRSRIRGI